MYVCVRVPCVYVCMCACVSYCPNIVCVLLYLCVTPDISSVFNLLTCLCYTRLCSAWLYVHYHGTIGKLVHLMNFIS